MRRVIIVQARMTSTRLPGKVLADLAGRPMLLRQLERLARCRQVDEIVVATTTQPTDAPVLRVCDAAGVRWFRGDEHDVLGRYLGAAREAAADLIVRITSDCPLIDPAEADRVVEALLARVAECDYAANFLPRTYPQGLDTEALFRDTLERVGRLARSASAREHVTHFIYGERPDLFARYSVVDADDNSDLRWTVDTPEDLAFARRVYEELGLGEQFLDYRTVLAFVRSRPDLSAVNAGIKQRDP
jgi:spore coat polysaccharide biosynthesis protein SpsF